MMNNLRKWTLYLLAMVLASSNSTKLERESQTLRTLLSPDMYDASVRPSGRNDSSPVVVNINIYIRSLTDPDDKNMEFGTQLTFRQSWKDDRLKYNDSSLPYLSLTKLEKIWKPDVFFSNEKSGHFHDVLVPNNLIRIFPDGTVLYSTRITLKLSCYMDLGNYPFDNQACSIVLASYGYTTEDTVFRWKEDNPVQITKNLHLAQFTLTSFFTDYCRSKTNTGEYSCLKLDLLFSRKFGSQFQKSYLPTLSLVLFSWIAFWLDYRSSTSRFAVWLAAVLGMFVSLSNISDDNPTTSYTKAIDVWTGTCLTFVFCCLIELCIVNNAVMAQEKHSLQNQLLTEEKKTDKYTMVIDDQEKQNQLPTYTFILLKWLNKYPTKAQRVDVISRFLFPASFGFFNLVYWLSYTTK